jgi:Bacteriophage related domain of unknown function
MSLKNTLVGLTKRVETLSPSVPTAYEGVSFNSPSTIYQRVQFRVQQPDDPVLGTGYYRERVELQIFVYGTTGQGVGEVLDHAELIREHFKKSTTIVESTTTIHVLETPTIAGTTVIGDRLMCPVLIPVVAEISN